MRLSCIYCAWESRISYGMIRRHNCEGSKIKSSTLTGYLCGHFKILLSCHMIWVLSWSFPLNCLSSSVVPSTVCDSCLFNQFTFVILNIFSFLLLNQDTLLNRRIPALFNLFNCTTLPETMWLQFSDFLISEYISYFPLHCAAVLFL